MKFAHFCQWLANDAGKPSTSFDRRGIDCHVACL